MQKNIFLVFLISLVSLTAFAKEEILSITDNDDNNEVYRLIVNVDDNTQSLTALYKDTYINGTLTKRDILDEKDLTKKSGVIIERRDNYNVLNLKSDNFDHDRGGRIIIDTLFNAITGDRSSYDLELAKDNEGWKLFKDQKTVSKFHVKVNRKIIIGTVGIKTILME